MRRKYRIAHVITRLDLGGAQQNTLYCVRHHDRSRFDVELVAGTGGELDEEARAIPDARVELVPYLEYRISPLRDLVALFRLRAHFRRRNVDLVHTHSSKAGIVGRLAAFLAGVPGVIHTAHGWSFNPTQPVARRRTFVWLERIAARISGRLLTVSRRGRDDGIRLRIGRPGQVEVLYSGIDRTDYHRPVTEPERVREALGVEPHHLLVGTVACLKPQKAPLDFVRAAAAAHARCERARFCIAGDGDLRTEVEAEVSRLGLEGVVQLLGWRRDIADLLHAMDVFLLTSRFEGLPRVVLQAMAAGVPIVASAVDGTPEVIRNGSTGLLFPPGDPRAAAERVLEFAADAELRRRCADGALGALDARFDIGRMVRELEEIYISLLEACT